MLHVLIIAGIVLGIIVVLAMAGFANIAKHKMHRYGGAVYIWRFLTGNHWDGQLQTNAGWVRRGTKPLTRSGFAQRFYFLPRIIRTTCRTGGCLLPFTIIFGLLANPTLLLHVGTSIVAGCVAVVFWRLATLAKRRAIRRDVLTPLHASIAPMADMPLNATPSNWIHVTDDRKKAVIKFPPNYHDNEKQRDNLASQAAKKLAMEGADVKWNFTGKQTTLTLLDGEPPAEKIFLADVRAAIDKCDQEEIVLGMGKKGKKVIVSLHNDSPHLGASMRGGAGKSTLARFVAAQALYKGAIVLILDLKQISHPWARGLPNVLYADTKEKIHTALMWAGGELTRRNGVALYSSDVEGNVVASVGPRVLVICEELNMTLGKLRSLWIDEMGGNGQSPAILALQDIAFAGRQVRMNLFMVGQMLSARASGGGEARENVGVRILAKYTKNAWNMLVPEFEMPPVSGILGRMQVVYSGEVKETQVAYLTGREAHELAVAGIVSPLPFDVPTELLTTGFNPPAQTTPQLTTGPITLPNGAVPITPGPVDGTKPITLSDALSKGVITGTINTVRHARQRDKDFPHPVKRPSWGNQLAHYYDPLSLSDWEEKRKKNLCLS